MKLADHIGHDVAVRYDGDAPAVLVCQTCAAVLRTDPEPNRILCKTRILIWTKARPPSSILSDFVTGLRAALDEVGLEREVYYVEPSRSGPDDPDWDDEVESRFFDEETS